MGNAVEAEVAQLQPRVDGFAGSKTDKEYRYLEEMLTRQILRLDSVDSAGMDAIRQARKRVVAIINAAVDVLELKAMAGASDDKQSSTNNSNQNNSSNQRDSVSSRVKEMKLDSEVAC